jgi:ribulose-5-phosphate 4-epimerase/fuculose-1-phosphate aldolase
MDENSELKKDLLTACRILDREGVMDELGHFSARVPGEEKVWMNGRISPGQASEEDLVLLDLDGKRLEGRLDPAKEIPLHLAVYRKRSDVAAIAHTHSPTIISLSAVHCRLRAIDNLGAAVFGKEVPVFEELGLINDFEIGGRMADALGSATVLVLRGHGKVAVGKSIPEACVSAIWAEKSALLQYRSMLLGQPDWFPEQEIEKVRRQVTDGKAFERAWNYFTWRLNG